MLIAAVLGISMTSCNSDSDVKDTVTTQSLSSCYAVVSDLENGGKTSLCTSVVIKLTLNWTTGRAEAGITGLVIGNQTYPQIVMKDIPWGFGDDNWGSAISATPTMETSASGITPAVTSFNLRLPPLWVRMIQDAASRSSSTDVTTSSVRVSPSYSPARPLHLIPRAKHSRPLNRCIL